MSTRSVRNVRLLAATPGRPAGAPCPAAPEAATGLGRSPWLALCPRDAVVMRDPDPVSLGRLPSGAEVAMVTDGLLARRRLRRRARRSGIVVQRELIVVPGTRSPIVALDDTEAAVRHFWSHVAAVPPGLVLTHVPATLLLLAVRLLPWRWTGALAPGRVLVGSRR